MTNKFTEEQYQKIIEIKDNYFPYSALKNRDNKSFIDFLSEYNTGIYWLVFNRDLENELEAIVNPLTREWARDKFVDKEPEFHFILKDTQDLEGWRYHLVRNGRGAIILYPFSEEYDDNPKFKESEIKLWGFNPEMFYKK